MSARTQWRLLIPLALSNTTQVHGSNAERIAESVSITHLMKKRAQKQTICTGSAEEKKVNVVKMEIRHMVVHGVTRPMQLRSARAGMVSKVIQHPLHHRRRKCLRHRCGCRYFH
jgi:hypothetical protein